MMKIDILEMVAMDFGAMAKYWKPIAKNNISSLIYIPETGIPTTEMSWKPNYILFFTRLFK